MDFGALPPEINSARIYTGPGSGPMLAAAAAWDGLAADLHSTAAAYGSVISGLTGGSWLGPASASMAAAATSYVAWMNATATQAEQTATQGKAAASAYEAAFAMTVPPAVITANRAQLAALIATNIFGQNTAAIAATEAHYGEMWAQDAAAMYGYAGSSAAASTLTPFTPPPPTTHSAGIAGQAAAVAHAAGTAVGTHAQTATSLSAVPQTLHALAQPLQSTSSTSGLSQMALGTETSAASSVASAPASALAGLTGASSKAALTGASKSIGAGANIAAAADGSSTGLIEDTAGLGLDAFGLVGPETGGFGVEVAGTGVELGTVGTDALTAPAGLGAFGGLGAVGGLGPLAIPGDLGASGALGGAGAWASVGQASSFGALSVPQSWANAVPASWANAGQVSSLSPAFRPVAMALPSSSATVVQEALTDTSGNAYSDMALACMAGRALGGGAGLGRRDRAGVPAREGGEPPQRPPSGLPTGIAAELREVTQLLRELGELRDSGILTDDEFREQKRRLLGR